MSGGASHTPEISWLSIVSDSARRAGQPCRHRAPPAAAAVAAAIGGRGGEREDQGRKQQGA